jgi:hypothetical protein
MPAAQAFVADAEPFAGSETQHARRLPLVGKDRPEADSAR